MKKIESVKIKRMFDEDPDTSHMGKYTDDADDWNIDRRHGEYVYNLTRPVVGCAACEDETREQDEPTACTDHEYDPPRRGREFNFFKPYAGGEKPGTDDYQKYGKQDYERMESLNNGNWNYIGIRAEAKTHVKMGDSWKIDTLTSGGLWGIESDSDKSYFKEVAEEELSQLRTILKEYGFSKSQIDKAFADVETEDL